MNPLPPSIAPDPEVPPGERLRLIASGYDLMADQARRNAATLREGADRLVNVPGAKSRTPEQREADANAAVRYRELKAQEHLAWAASYQENATTLRAAAQLLESHGHDHPADAGPDDSGHADDGAT